MIALSETIFLAKHHTRKWLRGGSTHRAPASSSKAEEAAWLQRIVLRTPGELGIPIGMQLQTLGSARGASKPLLSNNRRLSGPARTSRLFWDAREQKVRRELSVRGLGAEKTIARNHREDKSGWNQRICVLPVVTLFYIWGHSLVLCDEHEVLLNNNLKTSRGLPTSSLPPEEWPEHLFPVRFSPHPSSRCGCTHQRTGLTWWKRFKAGVRGGRKMLGDREWLTACPDNQAGPKRCQTSPNSGNEETQIR